MPRQNLNDTDSLNDGADKINNNFIELYSNIYPAGAPARSVLKIPRGGGYPSFLALEEADLPLSGVTNSTYGNAQNIPSLSVSNKGIINSASNIALAGIFKNYRSLGLIKYLSTTSFTIGETTYADSTNAFLLSTTGTTTVNLSTTGLNALDSGTIAANTAYYLYMIAKADGSGAGFIVSTTNEASSGSITLPTSYTLKKQLPFAIFTKTADAHILNFLQTGYDIWFPDVTMNEANATEGQYDSISIGTASTATTLTCKGVPGISKMAFCAISTYASPGADGVVIIKPTGSSGGLIVSKSGCNLGIGSEYYDYAFRNAGSGVPVLLNSSQQFDYHHTAGQPTTITTIGYRITEVI